MSDISTWSNSAASNNTAPPDGAPEGMNPSDVNNVVREVMAALRRQHEDAQWINLGHTPTFATSTTFTVAGDLTGTYDVGRRIRCTDASTLYGEITASSYSAPNTTVTVSLDSGVLSASLTAVSLGILSGTNQSIVTPGTRLDGAGVAVIRGDQNVDLDQRGLYLQHFDGTTRAELSHNGTTTTLNLTNYVPAGDVAIFGHTTGGALRVLWAGNANDGVDEYYQNVVSTRTVAASSGGLTVNNTLTGPGFERVLTVSDLNPPLSATKSGSESVTNSTTLQNDDNLVISSIPATTLYKLDLMVNWSEGGGDIRFTVTPTGTLTNSPIVFEDYELGSPTIDRGTISPGVASVATNSTANGNYLYIHGYVLFTTSNNTLAFQWAQNTSNAAATSVAFGYMTLTPV